MTNPNDVTRRFDKDTFLTFEEMDLNLDVLKDLAIDYNNIYNTMLPALNDRIGDFELDFNNYKIEVNQRFNNVILSDEENTFTKKQIFTDAVQMASATISNLVVNTTFRLPRWKDNTRPNNPLNGVFGFNTDQNNIEFFDGANWKLSRDPQATQQEAVAGSSQSLKSWSPLRIRQAIVGWWESITNSYSRELLEQNTPSKIRNYIGLGDTATRNVEDFALIAGGSGANFSSAPLVNGVPLTTNSEVGQPSISGTVNFIKFSNTLELNGIVPALGLEIGDVIEVTGASASSGQNNGLRTVESITDDDTIILNYEHRNGAGSLSLTDETVSVTVTRIAKWFNAPLGLGQAWVDIESVRAKNTNYTSPTNRTTSISVSGYAPLSKTWSIVVNGETAAHGGSPSSSRMTQQLQATMPGGAIYSLQNPEYLKIWAELR